MRNENKGAKRLRVAVNDIILALLFSVFKTHFYRIITIKISEECRKNVSLSMELQHSGR